MQLRADNPDDTLLCGLRHPCSSYAPKTVLVCEALAHLGEFLITNYYGLGELLITNYYVSGAASSPMRWTLSIAARFGRRSRGAGVCA